MDSKKLLNRRAFLGQASCAGLGYMTFLNSFLNLKAINAAAISNSSVYDFNDYKAIVCVLLAGGNDSYNMLIPYDTTSYNEYSTARSGPYTQTQNGKSGLAIPRGELTPTRLNYNLSGKEWAVHPSMSKVKQLFDSDKLAFISNIGTLLNTTTTKNNYEHPTNSPIGLFSHSDQIQEWQTGIPNERTAKGWGGKMADMIGDCNPNQNISMNVSLSGSNIFQTGNTTIEYAINPYQGAIGLKGYDPNAMYMNEMIRTRAVNNLIEQTHQDIFKQTFTGVIKNARDGFVEFSEALDQAVTYPSGTFHDSYLGQSLEIIARTISVRNLLNFKRQTFFITVGGWDHHDDTIENQEGMLAMVSESLHDFLTALEGQDTPSDKISDKVLTMFISEFGRTLESNGNGSDHAWGGNTLVMGGSNLINGGQIHGTYPSLSPDQSNPLELGRGRLIPTTATDEYFAEIAMWFGVPPTDLHLLFPNIGEFYSNYSTKPIGFIK